MAVRQEPLLARSAAERLNLKTYERDLTIKFGTIRLSKPLRSRLHHRVGAVRIARKLNRRIKRAKFHAKFIEQLRLRVSAKKRIRSSLKSPTISFGQKFYLRGASQKIKSTQQISTQCRFIKKNKQTLTFKRHCRFVRTMRRDMKKRIAVTRTLMAREEKKVENLFV
jgi:hypothetical protein